MSFLSIILIIWKRLIWNLIMYNLISINSNKIEIVRLLRLLKNLWIKKNKFIILGFLKIIIFNNKANKIYVSE